jgi:hypothetical protein
MFEHLLSFFPIHTDHSVATDQSSDSTISDAGLSGQDDTARGQTQSTFGGSVQGTPEISRDIEGFDSWTDQGHPVNPDVHDPVVRFPRPDWLKHTQLKSPWLYVEKATGNSHTSYTDIGDLGFVQANGSCELTQTHPSFIFSRPANIVHVTLEDITNSVHVKKLWDNFFSLKNTAPGGNGIKIVGYQKPIDPPVGTDSQDAADTDNTGPPETDVNRGKHDFVPFCFKSVKDVDSAKYRLTIESLKDEKDLSVVPFKDVMILRPRPLCDIPINIRTFIN